MKGMRVLAALGTLLLTACGSGSIQSPDFTRELVSITVTPSTATVAAGQTITLAATGTTTAPPGSDPTTAPVSSPNWSVSDATIATIDKNGVVTGVKQGTVTVTASKDGVTSNKAMVTVGPAVLVSIKYVLNSDSTNAAVTADTIAAGGSQTYRIIGTYSNGTTAAVTASFSSSANSVVQPTTPADPTSIKTLSVPSSATPGASATVTATSGSVTTTLKVTVGPAALVSIAYALNSDATNTPVTSDTIPMGGSQTYKIVGTYSDGSTALVAASFVSANTAIVKPTTPADPTNTKTLMVPANAAAGATTTVTATSTTSNANGSPVTATIQITVGQAVLVKINYVLNSDTGNTPISSDTIALGAQQTYRIIGTYSNGATTPVTANFVSSDNSTVNPTSPADPTSIKTLMVPTTATPGGSAVVTATGSGANSNLTTTLTVTVGSATLTGNITVILTPASPIPINSTTQASAMGTFSDGSTQSINGNELTWSSSDPTLATVDKNTGLVTTIAQGTVTITGTLNPNAEPQVTGQRSGSVPLLVTGAVCTNPFLAPQASVTTSTSTLCVGCSVSNASALIDGNDSTAAEFDLSVSAGGSATAAITSTTTYQPTGGQTGFIIGVPAGSGLSAQISGALTLSTTLNGIVQESNALTAGLQINLLGTPIGTGIDASLITITPSKPYNGLSLSYSAGVGLLVTLDAFSACATAVPP